MKKRKNIQELKIDSVPRAKQWDKDREGVKRDKRIFY